MTRTVFFDLDGTLTNSKKGILSALHYAFDQMHQPQPDGVTLMKFIGPALPDSLREFTAMQTLPEIKRFIEAFQEYYGAKGWSENEVFPGISPMLQHLNTAGIQVAVATAKPEKFSVRICDHFEFTPQLIGISAATNDEVTRTQKADIVAYGLTEFKIEDLANTIMVGDRASDIHGGQVNHLKTIGVGYGFGTLEELNAAQPTYLAPTVADLEQKLLDWSI
ncbi:HAD hydrolase-like protein [Agrilactobacillus yilanensis]|uniref:HAD hydrolase-like protein n=1 Tax=Agrilactobacillus yilanensis TaxID=2485997 RepID=A0ABW4J714_9LACO|nr:HAD hydrolase-like protein [Agrilactobacillus yilanensis]